MELTLNSRKTHTLHLHKLWTLCRTTWQATFLSYLELLKRVSYSIWTVSSYFKAIIRFKIYFIVVFQIQIEKCWEKWHFDMVTIFIKTVKVRLVSVTFSVRLLWILHFNVKLFLLTFPREYRNWMVIILNYWFYGVYFTAWLILIGVICY